jgi:3D-(3,5/4)-trihydroxycyclohexane-1,2-dione acylhydrolase (decyclizing)
VADGHRQRFVPASLGIFGHGNVAGLGQALDQFSDDLPFVQGRNEQGLAHSAVAFAKAHKRRQTLAVTASVGPGAMNMVTPAALATINRIPLLLLARRCLCDEASRSRSPATGIPGWTRRVGQ